MSGFSMDEKNKGKKATDAASLAAKKAAAQRAMANGEAAVLAKIAQISAPCNAIAWRLHELIMSSASGLTPRVRYGLPRYMKDEKSWCFFRAAEKFGFITFGFDAPANLTGEEGSSHQLVASAYRITALNDATEAKISAVVCKAASSAHRRKG
jgi:hypothetical protein